MVFLEGLSGFHTHN